MELEARPTLRSWQSQEVTIESIVCSPCGEPDLPTALFQCCTTEQRCRVQGGAIEILRTRVLLAAAVACLGGPGTCLSRRFEILIFTGRCRGISFRSRVHSEYGGTSSRRDLDRMVKMKLCSKSPSLFLVNLIPGWLGIVGGWVA